MLYTHKIITRAGARARVCVSVYRKITNSEILSSGGKKKSRGRSVGWSNVFRRRQWYQERARKTVAPGAREKRSTTTTVGVSYAQRCDGVNERGSRRRRWKRRASKAVEGGRLGTPVRAAGGGRGRESKDAGRPPPPHDIPTLRPAAAANPPHHARGAAHGTERREKRRKKKKEKKATGGAAREPGKRSQPPRLIPAVVRKSFAQSVRRVHFTRSPRARRRRRT